MTAVTGQPPDQRTPRKTKTPLGTGRLGAAPYYVIMSLWAAGTIFIFLWLFNGSLKSNVQLFGDPWGIAEDPLGTGIDNYVRAWTTASMGQYFANSVLVTTVAVVLTVAVSAPAAYVLSRINFAGNTALTYYFIAGMGMPFQLILVPLYVLLVQTGMVNTLTGLVIVYVGVSIPFTILLLTGFFRSLPGELEEAAAVDGTSEFGIFFRIMMPIATPGLFTAAIFNFVMIWQEFLLAQLIITSDPKRTLPVGLLNLRQTMQYNGDWSAMFAAVMIVVIPSFIVFVALSERIMTGLTLGTGK